MPSTFTDAAGRVWTVAISVATVSRVRSLLSVDLMEAIEGKLIPRLMGDVILLCDVLYCVCKPEADSRGVTDVQFGESMGGDALQAGEEALMESLAFFSHPSKREAVRRAWAKAKEFREKATAVACKKLEDPSLDRKLDALLEKAMAEGDLRPPMPGSSSGSSQGSSESTQTR